MKLTTIITLLILSGSLMAEKMIGIGLNASKFYDGESFFAPGYSIQYAGTNAQKKVSHFIEVGWLNRLTLYRDKIVFTKGRYHTTDIKFSSAYLYVSPQIRLNRSKWFVQTGPSLLRAVADNSKLINDREGYTGDFESRFIGWSPTDWGPLIDNTCVDFQFTVGKSFKSFELSLSGQATVLEETNYLHNIYLNKRFITMVLQFLWKI